MPRGMRKGFREGELKRLEAAWSARDHSEVLELRALVSDLHGQLDAANAAAVRMARAVLTPDEIEAIEPSGGTARWLRLA